MFNDQVYHLGLKNVLPIYQLLNEQPSFLNSQLFENFKNQIAHKLMTVCTVYDEYPHIQYQGSSVICKAIATQLHKNLKEFYRRTKNVRYKEPRGKFVIPDRSFDIISPVAHDYYYQSIVYDTIKDLDTTGKTKVGDKIVFLNEKDDLWVRFRYRHLAEVMNKCNLEVKEVIKDSKKGRKVKADEMNLAQMADLIRHMPKVEEMMKNY